MSASTLALALLLSVAGSDASIVNIGTCSGVAVQGGTSITFGTPSSTILYGTIGSPTAITGATTNVYGLTAARTFSGSGSGAQSCSTDLTAAVKNSQALACTSIASELGDLTYLAGVYCGLASVLSLAASKTLTLDGASTPASEWVFIASTTLTTFANSNVRLINGAMPCNIYWSLGTSATLGAQSSIVGTIMAGTTIAPDTNSIIVGRALAGTGATFAGDNTVDLECSTPYPHTYAFAVNFGGCNSSALQSQTAMTFDGLQSTITLGNIAIAPGVAMATGMYKLSSGNEYYYSSTSSVTQAYAMTCEADMKYASAQAAVQICANKVATELGGATFYPGVYCTADGTLNIAASTVATMDAKGDPTAEFTFKALTTLITGASCRIALTNSASAGNIYWSIGSSATLGASSFMIGNVMTQVSITMNTGSTLIGRGLAYAAYTCASGCTITLAAQTGKSNYAPTFSPTLAPAYNNQYGTLTSSPSSSPVTCPTTTPAGCPPCPAVITYYYYQTPQTGVSTDTCSS